MLKKFSEKLKDQVMKELQMKQSFVAEIKEVEDRTFEVVASTEGTDRDGEVLIQAGLDMKNYLLNPVILFGHDYHSLPIGKATAIEQRDGKTIIRGVFASKEANPLAEQVFQLYKEGILKAVSVGFIAKRYDGMKITESELLELSFVPVPANPEALSVRNFAKELVGMAKQYKMNGELALVIKSAKEQGMEVAEEYDEVENGTEQGDSEADDIDTPNDEKNVTEEQLKAFLADFKELKEGIVNELKSLKDELSEMAKGLDEKLVGLQVTNVKDESQSDEVKSLSSEDAKQLLKKTQMADSLLNEVNAILKRSK